MALKYSKPESIYLKGNPEYSEKWLQDIIAEDPTILGLGNVKLVERERRQEKAGRLDLMLYDRERNTRYEVELMLGASDESHVIRCIEYWDIERRRYPGYEHCAVLVAENITSRFLNVLSLFSGSIPLIAIQLSALRVSDQVVLNFVRVLDSGPLRIDDTTEAGETAPTDRSYWNTRSTPQILEVIDSLLEIVNKRAKSPLRLNYTKSYIGLNDGARSRNFIHFEPFVSSSAPKQSLYLYLKVANIQELLERVKQTSLEAGIDGNSLWITLTPKDIEPNLKLITDSIYAAVDEYQSE